MNTKICSKCKVEKNTNEFYKDKNNKIIGICKSCKKEYYQKNKDRILNKIHSYYKENCEHIKEYKKEYRKNNTDEIKIKRKKHYEENKDDIIKKQMIYYLNNKNNINEKKKIYRNLNKDKIKEYKKIYRINNKEKINNYNKNKYKNDYIYRLIVNIRNGTNRYINAKGNLKNKHTEEILGCNYEYLIKYLLQTFKNNYGYEWDFKEPIHIDHIIPLSSVNNEKDILKLNHYTNLQLLKAKDNLKKGSKLNWNL